MHDTIGITIDSGDTENKWKRKESEYLSRMNTSYIAWNFWYCSIKLKCKLQQNRIDFTFSLGIFLKTVLRDSIEHYINNEQITSIYYYMFWRRLHFKGFELFIAVIFFQNQKTNKFKKKTADICKISWIKCHRECLYCYWNIRSLEKSSTDRRIGWYSTRIEKKLVMSILAPTHENSRGFG